MITTPRHGEARHCSRNAGAASIIPFRRLLVCVVAVQGTVERPVT
ncbi:hypothetical protein [Streptomyces sp. NPDC048825]